MRPAAPGGLYRGHGGAVAARERLQVWGAPRRRASVIDACRWLSAGAAAEGYAAGDRVFHRKFGYGRIRSVDGDKLEVAFDKAGTKKIIDRFVQPADSV